MKRQAVTLIELLIVITIIGVISLIAIPNFSGTRSAAFHAHAQNSMAHITHAAKIYNAEQGTAGQPYCAAASIAHGQFEANLGTNVSGIELTAIDSDAVWNYGLNCSTGIITATFAADGACSRGDSFTYNLNTNAFGAFSCTRP